MSANAGDETSAVKVFGFGVFNGGLPNRWLNFSEIFLNGQIVGYKTIASLTLSSMNLEENSYHTNNFS